MKIGGLQKLTLIDYPGKPAATIFLAGCNFRCPFCYSKELVLPKEIENHPQILEKEVFDFLKERKGFIDGVIICGGEPSIHKELPQFIKKIKDLGFLVKLDTNGSNPKMLRKLIEEKMVDYVAMDIKGAQKKYEKATGVNINIEDIKESVKILKEGKTDYEFRTTVVPKIHAKEDFLEIGKWIGGNDVKYYLQNFRAEKTINPQFEKTKPFLDGYILEIIKEISPFFKICKLRQ
ncbi:MAG: anaerobic ribonucleoside-triphosphate reductase activating protein [Candidatus Pacebacteria bacterium]|nr:anaerobic ribonucleoside-triphosphate reductase activating protein [Candidatus Paceibacterota bacterium]MDD3072342.1 anaerobic ribonucleoside-triphosphate reductase activating protein [Candidatus Paceibacterota bacterium]MDD3728728.1 anaerobic ribonucleoside-triphosphate reductase activating protein [Candidatus Paceibacterota bacterium]MDD4201414.1 anaerobic ribonucleoside-triphosphate reductase activating protein [Candidatus Paceibacterota bacterium]MDD4466853.1 anaerobic ribonucleoside-tri